MRQRASAKVLRRFSRIAGFSEGVGTRVLKRGFLEVGFQKALATP